MKPLTNQQLIPTNIITGFLGAGKTSAILNLLKQKPDNETWAVLVNEFGEIGIDGSLIAAGGGIGVREVPGGCMCCTSGVPMQVALNSLIKDLKPDHILIEPTGLGHPKEVLQVLKSETYSSVLNIQTTIALLDARKLFDDRYLNHETFIQQLYVADVIVANKAGEYSEQDRNRLHAFISEKGWGQTKTLISGNYGDVNINYLDQSTSYGKDEWVFSSFKNNISRNGIQQSTPNRPVSIEGENEIYKDIIPQRDPDSLHRFESFSQGYFALGWQFPRQTVFHLEQLNAVLKELNAERIKAVVTTPEGIWGINLTAESSDVSMLENPPIKSNIIEIISITELEPSVIEKQLTACSSNS